jgi:superfamily II DNA or RNA helicase
MLALAQTDGPSLITLRPYQLTCVERAIEAFQLRPKGGRALIVLPTGCGKTVVFTEIARRLGLNTLVIAHRKELLKQAADEFRMTDPLAVIGQVGDGKYEWGAPITVANVRTISRPEHLKQLKLFGYGLIIIDECHHAAASGYQTVLDAFPDAFALGTTATPDRHDKQDIEPIFGKPLFSATIKEMVEKRYLSNLRAIAIPTTTSLEGLHVQGGDFNLEELEVAVDTPERNTGIVNGYLKHCHGRQALCFAVTVLHAEHLETAFSAAGIPATTISGTTPKEEREQILHDFERGIIRVVCNCGILIEGYNCPQISCILMARPTKSRALYTQCVGRGTRLAPGKRDCIILDITDNTIKHRLEPLNLSKMLGFSLQDGESILEAKQREEREQQEQAEREDEEKKERFTKVTRRTSDLEIDVLSSFDWQRKSNGVYHLEVGEPKHRIFLFPSDTLTGYYAVWARLAPDFRAQEWLKEVPLEFALQHAEIKARLLQSDKKKLVDSNEPWRAWPVSDKQRFMLRKFEISFTEDMTSGEASDLIGKAIAERDRQKALQRAEKAAQKATNRHGKSGRASA